MSAPPDPAHHSDVQSPHRIVPPSRRRDKPILSCLLCRRRKLKCDRQQPCKTCADRGLAQSCTYSKHVPGAGPENKAPYNVHDRIDQLEKLVTTLMAQKGEGDQFTPGLTGTKPQSSPAMTDDSVDAELAGSLDRVKLENDATSYTSSSHWSSILEGISEVKEQLDQIPTAAQPRDTNVRELAGPDLLFGRQRHANLEEILAAVPPRSEADQLVDTFFSSMDMAPTIMHKPTFLRQYGDFWSRPYDTPVMWIGVLLSVFGMATRFQSVLKDSVDNKPPEFSLASARMDFYREKTVQCLILGNYSKSPSYTLECFLHYFMSEYLRSSDTQFGVWMLVGMMVRIAFRMGYHREPSRFSNITPFEGEMRRRIWSLIVQLDLMSSTQVGLPRMIHPSQYDVKEPGNLRDDDISEGMTELPPSRPHSEFTMMFHQIMRTRMLHVFARVVDVTNASPPPTYREIMNIDHDLKATYERMPENMKILPVRECSGIIENPESAMRRISLALNFLKSEMMLHRPYFLLGRTDSRYRYSRIACLNAALDVLALQQMLGTGTKPGGQLYSQRWRLWALSWRFSALINHDFLLATTVLLLDLDRDLISPVAYSPGYADTAPSGSSLPTRADIVEALTLTASVWEEQTQRSREAKKAYSAIKVVLGKVHAGQNTEKLPSGDSTPISQFDFANFVQQPLFDSSMTATQDASFNFNDQNFMQPMFQNGAMADFSGFSHWGGLDADIAIPTMTMPPFDLNAENTFQ